MGLPRQGKLETGDLRSVQTTSRSRNGAAAERQAEGPTGSPAFTAPPLVDGCQIMCCSKCSGGRRQLRPDVLLFLPALARTLLRW